jgi:hypothetical protein
MISIRIVVSILIGTTYAGKYDAVPAIITLTEAAGLSLACPIEI